MSIKYNCKKNGIKYFRKTKTIGHDLNGKAIKKEFYGYGEKDCDRQIEEYMNMLKRGLPANFEKITIEQLMNTWLWDVLHVSKKIKTSTFELYEAKFRNYIKDSEIGHLAVYNITSKPLQMYYNKLYEKGLTSSNIFNINKLMRQFFFYCIDNNYLEKNPCTMNLIEIPGDADMNCEDEHDIYFFNEKEIKTFINNCNNNTLDLIILTALCTGLRLGEILGLQYKNIDLANGKIHIKSTLSFVKKFTSKDNYKRIFQLQKPKTKTSIRTVPIPSQLIPLFYKHIEYETKKWNDNNLKFTSESTIFTTHTCNFIDCKNFRRAWIRFLKRVNIKYKKFHALRHTYASILFKNGANILQVKELLGHSSSNTTEKIYIHLYPNEKEITVNESLNNLLIDNQVGKKSGNKNKNNRANI